ncbi:MAG TPA: GNAT family N-acetyltransferase, partial [Acidimicrobiales bacterium]
IGLVQPSTESAIAEIGWWVAPGHRGRGVATTAARLMADWAVAELSVDAVLARCQADNPASVAVARAAGFTRCDVSDGTPNGELWRFG